MFIQLCKELGVPLAMEKTEGPSTTLAFLGIILDTVKMEIRLPDDKLQRIKATPKLGWDEKSHQATDSILGWASPTCHKNHQMW